MAGSFCEYLARWVLENVEKRRRRRWRSRQRANGTLAIAAVAKTRSDCTQWHAWSAVSEPEPLRNELWGPWRGHKFSAEELHPKQVPSIDYTSAHVELHALADLALMIAMAQAQASGSTRLCDRRTISRDNGRSFNQ
jgi:hypothetical protein